MTPLLYLAAGFAISLAWRAWDVTRRDARLWDAAYARGVSDARAELDVLAARHPDLGLGDGLTMAAVGRLLDKENHHA